MFVPKVIELKCRGQEDTICHPSEDSTGIWKAVILTTGIDPFLKSNSLVIQVHSLGLTLVQSVASAWTVPCHHLVVFHSDGCPSQGSLPRA